MTPCNPSLTHSLLSLNNFEGIHSRYPIALITPAHRFAVRFVPALQISCIISRFIAAIVCQVLPLAVVMFHFALLPC